jgi:hypothetical protein
MRQADHIEKGLLFLAASKYAALLAPRMPLVYQLSVLLRRGLNTSTFSAPS